MREAEIKRKTAETDISLSLNIDGSGRCAAATGCGFFDHMLMLFAKHGRFDLTVSCDGDTYVDCHHTVEDVGIALGEAFAAALGDKRGICRYGHSVLPMDEVLVLTAVDISGRSYLGYKLPVPTEKVGTFDTELVREFWLAFARASAMTLHIRLISGRNTHHIIECAFKSAARSLRQAASIDADFASDIPSTKGTL